MQKALIIIFIVAFVLIAGVVLTVLTNSNQALAPEQVKGLTETEALSLLESNLWAECVSGGAPGMYQSCSVDVSQAGDRWQVVVTYDGLYDDSTKASRTVATISEISSGQWMVENVTKVQQCWPERGHQDFSAEPCL